MPTKTDALVFYDHGGERGRIQFNGLTNRLETDLEQSGPRFSLAGDVEAESWGSEGLGLQTESGRIFTDTTGSGAISSRSAYGFLAPTFAAANSETIAEAKTVHISQPNAGTGVTITEAYALYISGRERATYTVTLSGSQQNVMTDYVPVNMAAASGPVVARQSWARSTGSASGTGGAHLVGFKGLATHAGTGDIPYIYGVEGAVQNVDAGATVTRATGLFSYFQGNAGTITDAYGVYINDANNNSGTIDTFTGFYFPDMGNGGSGTITAKYALKNDDADALIESAGRIIGLSFQATLDTPASAGATGTAGEIKWDADYIYVCTATDTWKRVAIATWP